MLACQLDYNDGACAAVGAVRTAMIIPRTRGLTGGGFKDVLGLLFSGDSVKCKTLKPIFH